MQAIVIGAGVVGSGLAFRLAQAGAQVTVLERSGPVGGTTGSTFAWINSNQKTPEDYFALNLAGMQAHLALRDELGEAPWLLGGGNLIWFPPGPEADDLERNTQRLLDWNYNAVWIDRQQVAELEPGLRLEEDVERVAYFPDEQPVDAPVLTRRLLDIARQLGATVRYGCEVSSFQREGDRITGVVLPNGERIHADIVINCAGPAAGRIARLAERELPMANTLGLIVRVSGVPASCMPQRVIHAPRIHIRPEGDGLLVLHHGHADDAVTNGDPVGPLADEFVSLGHDYLAELRNYDVRVSRWSIGTRPIPADGRTSAGPVSARPGYAEIVTHSGVTLSPLLAKLVAQQLLHDEIDPLLAAFSPDRFA